MTGFELRKHDPFWASCGDVEQAFGVDGLQLSAPGISPTVDEVKSQVVSLMATMGDVSLMLSPCSS